MKERTSEKRADGIQKKERMDGRMDMDGCAWICMQRSNEWFVGWLFGWLTMTETLKSDYFNESYRAVLFCGALCCAVQGGYNF